MTNHVGAAAPSEFESVVAEHQARLLRYARRLVRDSDSAQDIVQEAFLRYLKDPPQCADPRQLQSWLYRVTHNLCVDLIRKESRRRERFERMEPPALSAPPSTQDLEAEDVRKIVDHLLERLSATQRTVILLRLREGKTYREISEITGMSVSNVGFHLFQALKKLNAAIKKTPGKEAR